MANVTVDNLLDIGTTQVSSAKTILQQNGITFKGTSRPNPSNQINIQSQEQLEAELGSNLELPNNKITTIAIDDSFTLTKPIKAGLNSGLIMGSDTGALITYDNPNSGIPFIQNKTPGDSMSFLLAENLSITDARVGESTFIDVECSLFISLLGLTLNTFGRLGTIECPSVAMTRVGFFSFYSGFNFINVPQLTVNTANMFIANTTQKTIFSMISNVPVFGSFKDIRITAPSATSLLFLDPNTPAGSRFVVESSDADNGSIYKTTTPVIVDSVADNGSGKTRFTTASVHILFKNDAIVLSGFSEPYNGTFVVLDEVSSTVFDVDIPFTNDDTGTVDQISLDQTSPLVRANNNANSPDSKTASESSTNGILEVDGSGGVAVPIVDITPVSGDWVKDPSTQRFSVDTITGLVSYNGLNTITTKISYSLLAAQTSGAAQTTLYVVNINGVGQTKSETTIITAGTGNFIAGVYNGGNYILNPGDTLQLIKLNSTNTNNTDIQRAVLLINAI